MRRYLAIALFLGACTGQNPNQSMPSCGARVGDPCCYSPPSEVFCDVGLRCDAQRVCQLAPPDLAGADLSRPAGTIGARCDASSDCTGEAPDGFSVVECINVSPQDGKLCCFAVAVNNWNCRHL